MFLRYKYKQKPPYQSDMVEYFVLIFLIFKKLYVYLPQNNLKHQLMKKLILLILILMSGMMPTWAQSVAADDIAQLQKEMYQLYNKNDETAFVDITNKLKEAAQKANDERTFYKAWSNQALYFANHQQRNKGQLIAKDMQQYALNHDHKYGIYTGTHVMGTELQESHQLSAREFPQRECGGLVDRAGQNQPYQQKNTSGHPRCRTSPEGTKYQCHA